MMHYAIYLGWATNTVLTGKMKCRYDESGQFLARVKVGFREFLSVHYHILCVNIMHKGVSLHNVGKK